MAINRAQFAGDLSRLEPALNPKSNIPIFAAFCFYKDKIVAYDDFIALYLKAKPPIPFPFGVPGKQLIDYIRLSRSKDVRFEFDGENKTTAIIRCGKSKLKVPLLPQKSFQFPAPDISTGQVIDATAGVLQAVKSASMSISYDPIYPQRLGVTMVTTRNRTDFWATDDVTTCHVSMPKRGSDPSVVIIPPRFCDNLSQFGGAVKITVSDKWIAAQADDVTLLAKTILVDRPKKGKLPWYGKALEMEKSVGPGFPIPKGFARALERSLALSQGTEDVLTEFRVVTDEKRGTLLRMRTEVGKVEVHDVMVFDSSVRHPPIVCRTLPKLVQRGLSASSSIRFDKRCVMLRGKNFAFFVAVGTKA